MSNTIFLENVSKTFANHHEKNMLFENVSFSFSQKHTYAIMGISGSGKSTLLSIITGLESPTSGTVIFNDIDLYRLTPAQKLFHLSQYYGIVFQQPRIMYECTVIENVLLKKMAHSKITREDEAHAMELLELLNLADKKDKQPLVLSGGEQQRVSLARALYGKPAFLIADEPTAHVDVYTKDLMLNLLEKAHKEWNMGIILSTHDSSVAQKMDFTYSICCFDLHQCDY